VEWLRVIPPEPLVKGLSVTDPLAVLLQLDGHVARMNAPRCVLDRQRRSDRARDHAFASHYATMLAFALGADVLVQRDDAGATTIGFAGANLATVPPRLPDGYITFGDHLNPLIDSVKQFIGFNVAVVPVGAPVRGDGDVSAYDLLLFDVDSWPSTATRTRKTASRSKPPLCVARGRTSLASTSTDQPLRSALDPAEARDEGAGHVTP
jgi:hypothetical protein